MSSRQSEINSREVELAGILAADADVDRRTAFKYLRGAVVAGKPGKRLRDATQGLEGDLTREVLEMRFAAHKNAETEARDG